MTKLFGLSLILLLSHMVVAANLKDIAGTYQVTHPRLKTMNYISLSKNGNVTLTEISENGKITCTGKAKLQDNVVATSVQCENGVTFTQKINLEGVKNFSSFKAGVYSSLFESTHIMTFKKISH